MQILDRLLPEYRHRTAHARSIAAPPASVWSALLAVRPSEVRGANLLFGIRALPARLLGRPGAKRSDRRTVLESILAGGFLKLAEEPGAKIACGVIGKFWRWTKGGDMVPVATVEAWRSFAEPGFVRAAMAFEITPLSSGDTLLSTETRVEPLGEDAARKFARYWFFVEPGSSLLRRAWLGAVQRRAERSREHGEEAA